MNELARPSLSRSTEDYLKAIYRLESQSGAAQTSAIAEELEIAPPSVSGMVKRLSESGLIEHLPYRGVQLTAAGRREALNMLRRHRVIESYLMEKLGYDWDSVHEEAERLEHAVSDELIERMARALGDPQYDPHGAPIPTATGDIEEVNYVPMSEIPVGGVAQLRSVGDEDSERLRFLASLGLVPGTVFTVLARQPFKGPITLRLQGEEGRDEVVGFDLAKSLQCTRVEEEAQR
jgi:DtxR family Mn-dependent transcriptional regulator